MTNERKERTTKVVKKVLGVTLKSLGIAAVAAVGAAIGNEIALRHFMARNFIKDDANVTITKF